MPLRSQTIVSNCCDKHDSNLVDAKEFARVNDMAVVLRRRCLIDSQALNNIKATRRRNAPRDRGTGSEYLKRNEDVRYRSLTYFELDWVLHAHAAKSCCFNR